MKELSHKYSAIITQSYPGDIRVFISRILPILVEYYYLPLDFDKNLELNRFDWGNRSNRSEDFTLGEKGFPCISLLRNVFGNMEYTDEWESSTLELINFCPPQIDDTVHLKIECSESFLMTDKGTHQCTIDFETNNSSIYDAIMEVVRKILEQFKNACVEISEE